MSVGHDMSKDGEEAKSVKVKGKVSIGRNVWIASGATVLPGVTIGDGAVIGAGAVLIKDVEPYKMVAGVPARVI